MKPLPEETIILLPLSGLEAQWLRSKLEASNPDIHARDLGDLGLHPEDVYWVKYNILSKLWTRIARRLGDIPPRPTPGPTPESPGNDPKHEDLSYFMQG